MGRIDDGHPTFFVFEGGTSVTFWEKEVTPPGHDGGGEIDTTTMHNTAWRTRSPKQLKTLTESSLSVAYDPAVYTEILALLNDNQLITVHFANGDTLAFWGWLDKFAPGAIVEGEQPTADITIVPSNQNDAGAETAPVYTAA